MLVMYMRVAIVLMFISCVSADKFSVCKSNNWCASAYPTWDKTLFDNKLRVGTSTPYAAQGYAVAQTNNADLLELWIAHVSMGLQCDNGMQYRVDPDSGDAACVCPKGSTCPISRGTDDLLVWAVFSALLAIVLNLIDSSLKRTHAS